MLPRGPIMLLSELLGHILPGIKIAFSDRLILLSNCCLPRKFKLLRIVMHRGQCATMWTTVT